MRTLAIVPARSGSKSIPGKNVRMFAGKPLVAWAVGIGQQTCDEVCVSTDSSVITKAVSDYCQTREPGYGPDRVFWDWRLPRLAQDDTPMLDVLKRIVERDPVASAVPEYGTIVLLQPTQPLRTVEHVIAAMTLLEGTGADSVVSVVEIPAHYSPDYATKIEGNRLMPFAAPVCYMTTGDYSDEAWSEVGAALRAQRLDAMVARRQDARKAYSRDGTAYAIRRKTIENGSLYGNHCVPLIIPSHESVNLDTEEDWQRAEAMVKR